MHKVVLGLCCLIYILHIAICSTRSPKIAIIGGGIGGTSCAYFLKQLLNENSQITLYERDVVGGRLRLQNIAGKLYEAGGSVIHPKNKYMLDFLKMLGLKIRKLYGYQQKFGIYDGDKFVFQQSEWYIITMADFLWRYGLSVFELWKEVNSVLEDFSKIYKLQEEKYAYTTVYGMLDFMNPGFKNMTQDTLEVHLYKKGYAKRLLDELVQSVMMVNYGQTNNITAFAGYVSLAGSDSNLWSVDGGNKLIPSGLLAKSKANVVKGDVSEVELLPDGTYLLKYVDQSSGKVLTETYDIVILATPLVKGKNNIKFTNFQKDFEQFETKFHRTVTTFVKAKIKHRAFGVPLVPEDILTFNPHLLFKSIGRVVPVSNDWRGVGDVYKVFSDLPLTEKNLHLFFDKIEMYKVIDWAAYPHYDSPEKLPPFYLYPNLYYVNAIEQTASAMEMSAVAGRNCALLAYNLWYNILDKIDYHKKIFKDEL
ncbi:prenylcysteine oxidase 1 [Caerostris extrusa]|uniref:Prenylcysteine oxidase 1 n=1 Tax=Caerostris extrusa TaxID=172846 RepID=A0AAV4TE61_CAEEX|nr:prenylcysteine oxidase 1 [Caerostris extrusa]